MNASARGDWSNLKGDYYQLVYSLWLLLCEEGIKGIYWYQGNDIYAVKCDGSDLWIQCKDTAKNWTSTAILGSLTDKNPEWILSNFLQNVWQSNQRQRQWQLRFVTTGSIDRKDWEDCVSNYSSGKSDDKGKKRIEKQIDHAACALGKEHVQTIDRRVISDLVTETLSRCQLNQRSLESLETSIRLALSRNGIQQRDETDALNRISGAVLRWAGQSDLSHRANPDPDRFLTLDQLAKDAGIPLKGPTDTAKDDIIAVCQQVVTQHLDQSPDEVRVNLDRYAVRLQLHGSLIEFLNSNRTLFVLAGESGTGKSWSAAWLAIEHLKDCARVWWTEEDLWPLDSLEDLIQKKLGRDSHVSSEELLKRLVAAAALRGHAPVFIVDDVIPVDIGGQEAISTRNRLLDFVEMTENFGIKIIITCRTSLWKKCAWDTRLHRFLFRTAYSALSLENRTEDLPISFVLPHFTTSELRQAIENQLLPNIAERAWETMPSTLRELIRHPFMFGLYSEQVLASWDGRSPLQSMTVDDLLKSYIRLSDATVQRLSGMTVYPCQVQEYLNILALTLHQSPSKTISITAAQSLDLNLSREQQSAICDALINQGILICAGGGAVIYIHEPQVLAYLLVRNSGVDELSNALGDPQTDGVLSHVVLRHFANRGQREHLSLLDQLLARNPEWNAVIAVGLSQIDNPDWLTIGQVIACARAGAGGVSYKDCQALGYLAARIDKVQPWVEEMYLRGHRQDRNRGTFALKSAFSITPKWVGRLIEERLQVEINSNASHRERRVRDALEPIYSIVTQESAIEAQRVLGHIPDIYATDSRDYIRGCVAAYGDSSVREELIDELINGTPDQQCQAARSMLPISNVLPHELVEPVLNKIKNLTQDEVANRTFVVLLRVILNLAKYTPTKVFEQIKDIDAFARGTESGAYFLSVLQEIAIHLPDEVARVLPERWEDAISPPEGALLAESLVAAWWQCAMSGGNKAISVLDALRRQENAQSVTNYEAFILESKIVASVAHALVKAGTSLLFNKAVPPLLFPYGYIDLCELIARHREFLHEHVDMGFMVEQTKQVCQYATNVWSRYQTSLLGRMNEFLMMQACDHLACFVSGREDLVDVIQQMPNGRTQLRLANELWEIGNQSEDIRRFIEAQFPENSPGILPIWVGEKSRAYANISAIRAEQAATTIEDRASISTFGIEDIGRTLAVAVDRTPTDVLKILDCFTVPKLPVLAFWTWIPYARSRLGVLFSHLYGRMADPTDLTKSVAKSLCEQALAAIAVLPNEPRRDEYHLIYKCLMNHLQDFSQEVPDYTCGTNMIGESHALALDILQCRSEELDLLLRDPRGFRETTKMTLDTTKAGSITGKLMGVGYSCAYFPAVRLALIAVGDEDLAAQRVRKRHEATLIIDNWWKNLPEEPEWERELATLTELYEQFPNDERIMTCLGTAYLEMGEYSLAQRWLEEALCFGPILIYDSTARYNLAAVYAQIGDVESCKSTLSEILRKYPQIHSEIQEDTDFAAVRSEHWFQELLETLG